ncbi:crossover junction endodeoxyribonuclease RuvC [Patescibacteria group bacterium]|nr:crossover junction endodeoxyribonuclease RuvC [Patescibacteria group bacterium]
MLILGIDPGTATTGYGLLKVSLKKFEAVEYGLIETERNGNPGKRLISIHKQMTFLLKKHNPDVVAIERLFFAANAKTAMSVGEAKGVLIFSAAKQKVDVFEYAPGTIKKMVGGDGRADKKMMQKAVRKILGNAIRSKAHKKTHFDNAADALAVALCHAYSVKGVR